LFDDPQLNAGPGMMETRLPDGRYAKLPRLPLEIGAHEFVLRRQPPSLGEHNDEIIAELEATRAAAERR
jgi:crotonobetainyl-CoA:carnitine CoA-transferase CaiB-like acyl-CoA transferase